jgi:hypothetical protein
VTATRAALATCLGAAVLAVVPGSGSARRPLVDTFRGTCEAQVVVRMSPPMSSSLRQTRIDIATRSASCTGTVSRGGTTRYVDRARTTGRLHGAGNTSCLVSDTTGTGHFTIARRWRIDFTYVEPRLGPLGLLPYSGVAGGSALDFARLAPSENPRGIVARCGGAGVPRVLVDVTIVTAPYISG